MRSIAAWVMDCAGWMIALNAAAALSILGWVPAVTGIAPAYYFLGAFILSLPVAAWMADGARPRPSSSPVARDRQA